VGTSSFLLSFLCSYNPGFAIYSTGLLAVGYSLLGIPSLLDGVGDIIRTRGDIDVHFLMTGAAWAALYLGAAYEGALLLSLFHISHALQDYALQSVQSANKDLSELCPDTATIMRNGSSQEVPIAEVQIGDKIVVRAGEVIPLDGVVESGESEVDVKHVTGESFPVFCGEGDSAVAGGVNRVGSLVIRVTHTAPESTVSRILSAVNSAQMKKTKLVTTIEKYTNHYSKFVVLSSLGVVAIPSMLGMWTLKTAVYRALVYLVAVSPCALVIATPMSYFAAISACSRRGILLRGGNNIEEIAEAKILCLDKTGTVTTGVTDVVGMEVFTSDNNAFSESDFASLAATCSDLVTHPLSKGTVAYAREKSYDKQWDVSQCTYTPGVGLQATVNNQLSVEIGRVNRIDTNPDYEQTILSKWAEAQGKGLLCSLVSVKSDSEHHNALIYYQDTLRTNAPEILRLLQNNFSAVHLLTGDQMHTAKIIGASCGLSEASIAADLKPEDKAKIIEKFQSQNQKVIMVGDGINDAPALKQANVGIALGSTQNLTSEIADVVLLPPKELESIIFLKKKSEQTRQIIKQNLVLAGVSIIGAGAGALYGLPLWLAVIMHEGSTVLAVFNCTRIWWQDPK